MISKTDLSCRSEPCKVHSICWNSLNSDVRPPAEKMIWVAIVSAKDLETRDEGFTQIVKIYLTL